MVKKFIDKWTEELARSINDEIDQEIRTELGIVEPQRDYRKKFALEFRAAVAAEKLLEMAKIALED